MTGQVPIYDIRSQPMQSSLVQEALKGLSKEDGKYLPTVLLYSGKGLRLFEKITYLEEYYLTNAEIQVLSDYADEIVQNLPEDVQLLELGSGNLRKIALVLDAFERAQKPVSYYALDLSRDELVRSFSQLDKSYNFVRCYGLYGTYDDAVTWLDKPAFKEKPRCVMSLGSSLGNFSTPEATSFLKCFAEKLTENDSMLLGMDSCTNGKKVYKAYNDSEGVTREFYLDILNNMNVVLKCNAFRRDEWDVIGEYDERTSTHTAYLVPKVNISLGKLHLKKGERVFLERAVKYKLDDFYELCRKASLVPSAQFGNTSNDYFVHLLSSPSCTLPLVPSQYAQQPCPSLGEFQSLWKTWDKVTLTMIPIMELLEQPISLRRDLIFYVGHTPTFQDIQLSKVTGEKLTEPKSYRAIFERGIDPKVDTPEICHSHSEVPDSWPALGDILDYRGRVRQRVRSMINRLKDRPDASLANAIWLGFEHEAMHLETYLYMLLQSPDVQPPPGVARPDFKFLAEECDREVTYNGWFNIPEQDVLIGMNDPAPNTMPEQSFGWDNEKPMRMVHVARFDAHGRPISNGEYAKYLEDKKVDRIPASWIHETHEVEGFERKERSTEATRHFVGQYFVRTVFGKVPLEYALDWPVMASYDELDGYAKHHGCRIPTFEEVKSLYKHAEQLKNGAIERKNEVNIDLSDRDVAFKTWHPTAITGRGANLCGQGEIGGVWEWTSSTLAPYDGFQAMELYPGYTADFFDGEHNIMLGGSWATHPRLAGRTSFINWYQRNYPFTWATARLVRDH